MKLVNRKQLYCRGINSAQIRRLEEMGITKYVRQGEAKYSWAAVCRLMNKIMREDKDNDH